MLWDLALTKIVRRGERMIPWRTGRQGSWHLSDRFEDIYLDDYHQEQVDIQTCPPRFNSSDQTIDGHLTRVQSETGEIAA